MVISSCITVPCPVPAAHDEQGDCDGGDEEHQRAGHAQGKGVVKVEALLDDVLEKG